METNKMKKMPAVIGSCVVILLLSSMFSAAPFAAPVDLLQYRAGFDRSECEAECRRAYGGYEWAAPPLGEGGYYGYARCIMDCQRKFWKVFDKESEDLFK
ncbi:MAG: hypothetical protein P8182_03530 [Deltaproteobacteria bacterium]